MARSFRSWEDKWKRWTELWNIREHHVQRNAQFFGKVDMGEAGRIRNNGVGHKRRAGGVSSRQSVGLVNRSTGSVW